MTLTDAMKNEMEREWALGDAKYLDEGRDQLVISVIKKGDSQNINVDLLQNNKLESFRISKNMFELSSSSHLE